jgi:tight adherence protein B
MIPIALRSEWFLGGFVAAGSVAAALLVGLVRARASRWLRGYEDELGRKLKALFSPLTPRRFVLRQAALGLAGALAGGAAAGPFFAVLCGALCALVPLVRLRREHARRKKAIEAQLEAGLHLLGNTLLVTSSLEEGFATLARHFGAPLGQEADLIVKQVQLGTPMDQALADLPRRYDSRPIAALVAALTIGRKTGGELHKTIEAIAALLRDTMRVEGILDARTAEGKAQAMTMALLPFAFGAALQLIDPEWMRPLFFDPIGWLVLAGACALEIVAVLAMRRLVRLEV